jgi:hypothetical protein
VADQLKTVGVDMISCKLFSSKDSKSAHVVVPFASKEVARAGDTWIEGVRVRDWSFDMDFSKRFQKRENRRASIDNNDDTAGE